MMSYDGNSYDGNSYDGNSYDGNSYDGNSYDGNSYDGNSMTATAMAWLHMINKVMIAIMTKDHTVTIVTIKPRIKNMNVKQVHLKDSLPVQ